MGFGILLCGFALSMSNYPGYTDCIAFFIIFYAMLKLDEFNIFFRLSKYISFVCTVLGMAGIMLYAGEFIGLVDETNVYVDLYDNISEALKVVFGIFMLLGTVRISIETDLPKTARFGAWCICIDILWGVLFAISFFFAPILPFRMLMRLVYMLAVLYHIFSCYRMICLEGDEDMPEKPSRFEFVNRIRARLAEKAEAGNKKEEAAREYKARQAESRKNGVDITKTPIHSKKKR